MWATMIDVSRHQGTINFATMRARGVDYLILRVSHGSTEDSRARIYYRDAVLAGFTPERIGFYSFMNPKRGSSTQTASDTANIIASITGRTDVLYMLDVENFRAESPNKGYQNITGRAFANYLRQHKAVFEAQMNGARVIAYSNRAYWNSADGPNDDQLASELEWMVPRYKYYSHAAYLRNGYPPDPDQWAGYAFRSADGPFPPRGSGLWEGWQFSAGYNRQGKKYGCQSSDLDLNIIRTEAANRWFQQEEPPPEEEEEDMAQIRFTTTNREGQFLIPGGEPLTPAMVAALGEKVPKVVGDGPEEDARWDELKARWDAGQVAPGDVTVTVPPIELPEITYPNLSGTIRLTPDS